MDRGLTRDQLAARFQVRPGTLRAWECGSSRPAVRLIPAVLAFLGYDVDSPEGSIWDRVRWKRRRLGLSEAALGRLLGLAPSTFFRGECGTRTTSTQTLERLKRFLE